MKIVKLIITILLVIGCGSCAAADSRIAREYISETAADDTRQGREPALPQVFIDTTLIAPTGRTIQVAGGRAEQFQAALDRAAPGDVIVLEAGATYTGNFVLPKKNGSGWITIRSSASEEKLPTPGTRLTPSYASALPKIISANADAVFRTAPGAHHYRLIGLEISVAPGVKTSHGLALFGDGSESRLDALPHDLIIDRCWIHGNATANVTRGVALNSARTAIIDSSITDIHGVGFDTQAICGWNGPGPFKIVNNYLEGAGENVMFGGADPRISGLVPSDIEFRRNHCYKPLAWKAGDPAFAGTRWTVKNLFELKNARRVIVEGNLFEHNWVDAQNGFAILFTVRNQDGGAPWSVVQDVTFTSNIVRHSAAGINLLGRDNNHPSEQVRRLVIRNNLLEDIGGEKWGGTNRLLQLTDSAQVTIERNTMVHSGSIITAYGGANTEFTFTGNVTPHNSYGVIGDGTGPGAATLEKYFPGAIFKRNIIVGGRAALYPPDNQFPTEFRITTHADNQSQARVKVAAADAKVGCDLAELAKIERQAVAKE